jgi:hypothetical protein
VLELSLIKHCGFMISTLTLEHFTYCTLSHVSVHFTPITALLRGGAIFASAGTVTLSHCAFAHNYAVLAGGDCNVRHGAQLTATGSTFVGSASGGSGGSIAACGGSVEQCVFEGTSSSKRH